MKSISTNETKYRLPTFILEGNKILLTRLRFPLEFYNLPITQNHFIYLVPVFLDANGNSLPYATLDKEPAGTSMIMFDLCGQVLNKGTYVDAADIINNNEFYDIEQIIFSKSNKAEPELNITAERVSSSINAPVKYLSAKQILPISVKTIYPNFSNFPLFDHKILENAVHGVLGIEAPRLNLTFTFDSFNLVLNEEFNTYMYTNNITSVITLKGQNVNPYESLPSSTQNPLCFVSSSCYRLRLPYIVEIVDGRLSLSNEAYCEKWLNSKNDSFLFFSTLDKRFQINDFTVSSLLGLFKKEITGYKNPNLLPSQKIKICCSKSVNYEMFINSVNSSFNTLASFSLPEVIYYGSQITKDLHIELTLGGKCFIYLSDENDDYILKNNLKCELEYMEI